MLLRKSWTMRGKHTLTKLMVALGSVALLLAAFEVGLRFTGFTSAPTNVEWIGRSRITDPFPGVPYIYLPYTMYKRAWPDDPRSYFGTPDHSMTYRVNNYGFRGNDYELARNHRLRIAVIGDSICWGSGVKREHIFTTLIENGLNEQAVIGEQYEVLNFGLPGFNTANEVALYEQVVRHFQPDLLMIAFHLNDVNSRQSRFFARKSEPVRQEERASHLRTVEWLRWTLGKIRQHRAFIANVNAAYEEGHEGFASVVQGFDRIAELTRSQGTPTILTLFPVLLDLDEHRYPFSKPHERVAEAAADRGLRVLDLLATYSRHEDEELRVHRNDHHPNEIGHRLAADAMLSLLTEVLERHQQAILDGSARRRSNPVPEHLAQAPTRTWYEAFKIPQPGG